MTLLDRVQKLTPQIRATADRVEADGEIPAPVIESLAEAGVFRLAVPGGTPSSAGEMVAVLEEIGRADASTGWCAMIGAITGTALTYLPPETAASLLSDPNLVMAGVGSPRGEARAVEGGYRVTGRWSLASGCLHATWIVGGAHTAEGFRCFLMRAGEVTIHRTWDALGLRGTGSHDFSASDVFVPTERVFDPTGPARGSGTLSRYGRSALGFGVAAVMLGVARAAIEDFGGSDQARGLHGSGRAFLLEAFANGSEADQELAVVTAAGHATRATDLVYAANGTAAAMMSSPLQRYFRDVHTAAQHGMVRGGS
ncbi:acyl-CoA dehydrogenase family protein [Kineosporia succinea]|uniref:Alkylation response protein AidB-like acyl-CoA dehydrogenase n=1 Tax=Kineosporia succinea TaxID=84632 RepID=A0ABT9PAB2_9ACTN|nr:acyl-CoA dehydrogenase family protein [Kineosporia succinea]MDP9829627.1 alkylation response protein AidB-like acyl-CoA dehydrogenase [Kineosporia succinea]